MGKRTSFSKVDKDFYPTIDPRAFEAIIPFVRGRTYAEPCAGNGDLVDGLADAATCKWETDVREEVDCRTMDAMSITQDDLEGIDLIITNPPFTKSVLLPMIDHFMSLKPTWLLLPWDLPCNKYFRLYAEGCNKIVPIGRLCWFKKDGKFVRGYENFAWYYWPKGGTRSGTEIEYHD